MTSPTSPLPEKNAFLGDNGGNAVVEFAFMLPLFIILVLAAIEFGMWFFESEITTASVSNISQAIQRNPDITPTQLQQMVNTANDGLARLSFTNGRNYICVKAYPTMNTNTAQAGSCRNGDLNATDPNPASGLPYTVVVNAFVAPNPLTPLGNFIHSITPTQLGISEGAVSVVGLILPLKACLNTGTTLGILQYNPTATPPYSCFYMNIPPQCNGAGQVLEYSGGFNGTYTCVTVTPPPNCDNAWTKLEWDAATASWNCPNVPYVFAGGVAHPATTNGGAWAGGAVQEDSTTVPWVAGNYTQGATPTGGYALAYDTICEKVQFTVPTGLPAGCIVAQGNLIYPSAGAGGGDGLWHGWSVSFVKLVTSPGSGGGYVCMANGGNYATNATAPLINSEHVSWTVTFLPTGISGASGSSGTNCEN